MGGAELPLCYLGLPIFSCCTLISAKIGFNGLESQEPETISSGLYSLLLKSLHLWLSNSISTVPFVAHVMLIVQEA